jgi:hypothetical protein
MPGCYSCAMCRAYVYDILQVPVPSTHDYYGFYNLKSVRKVIPELVPEFHRIASDHCYELFRTPDLERSMYIVVRAIESGLVRRSGITYHGRMSRGRPIDMASSWVNHYFKQLVYLQVFHREHSGGFVVESMPPLNPDILQRYRSAGVVLVEITDDDPMNGLYS